MWADIDYMDDYKLFTISQQSYPTLAEKVDLIKKDDRTFVPIMDAGVAVRLNQDYKALDLGLEKDVFIKQDNHKDPLTAGVWCGNAYFPDFFKPETVEWWSTMFDDLYTA
jgi:alpha-glucosidase